jgi:BASS family bile acid:Na+ symporter
MNILKGLRALMESHLAVVALALAIGIIFSDLVTPFSQYSTIFLGIIFFLSSLKIDIKTVINDLTDKGMLIAVNLFMLIVFPIAIYFITLSLYPSLAIAFLILAAMPSGMTAPLLSEITGGRQSLALVLTVTTSLLAPITVPFMIKTLAGAEVSVSFWDMSLLLATVIYIPFIAAQVIKHYGQDAVDRIAFTFKPISVFFLGVLITVVIAKQADAIISSLTGNGLALVYLGLLFVLFIIFHIAGYFTIFWRNPKDRVTITVCLAYMNFTLAIELANTFFSEPNIVLPVVLSVIPWAVLLVPYKWTMKRLGFVG